VFRVIIECLEVVIECLAVIIVILVELQLKQEPSIGRRSIPLNTL